MCYPDTSELGRSGSLIAIALVNGKIGDHSLIRYLLGYISTQAEQTSAHSRENTENNSNNYTAKKLITSKTKILSVLLSKILSHLHTAFKKIKLDEYRYWDFKENSPQRTDRNMS